MKDVHWVMTSDQLQHLFAEINLAVNTRYWLGNNAQIGAGAVVVSDVAPNVVVVGVPAKELIRMPIQLEVSA